MFGSFSFLTISHDSSGTFLSRPPTFFCHGDVSNSPLLFLTTYRVDRFLPGARGFGEIWVYMPRYESSRLNLGEKKINDKQPRN